MFDNDEISNTTSLEKVKKIYYSNNNTLSNHNAKEIVHPEKLKQDK